MRRRQDSESIEDDEPALDALRVADPADAPDIAEGLASSLQRELDQTDLSGDTGVEEQL